MRSAGSIAPAFASAAHTAPSTTTWAVARLITRCSNSASRIFVSVGGLDNSNEGRSPGGLQGPSGARPQRSKESASPTPAQPLRSMPRSSGNKIEFRGSVESKVVSGWSGRPLEHASRSILPTDGLSRDTGRRYALAGIAQAVKSAQPTASNRRIPEQPEAAHATDGQVAGFAPGPRKSSRAKEPKANAGSRMEPRAALAMGSSRPVTRRSVTATSERMDATGGESAALNNAARPLEWSARPVATEGLVSCRDHNPRGYAAVNADQLGWGGNRPSCRANRDERFGTAGGVTAGETAPNSIPATALDMRGGRPLSAASLANVSSADVEAPLIHGPILEGRGPGGDWKAGCLVARDGHITRHGGEPRTVHQIFLRGRAARSARDAHNVEVTGSNPVPATSFWRAA
jgi:hypothetical protein